MRLPTVQTALMLVLAWPAQAELVFCDGVDVSVIASNAEDARLTCAAAARARALFETCNVPTITRPLTIEVIEDTDAIDAGCFGLYHCGQDRIEVLAPATMADKRQKDGFLATLPGDRFFQSIVAHELTHAAIEDAPCPFTACLIGNEYVAYVMQIMSWTQEQRRRLAAHAGLDRQISRDELNPALYFLAPERFAVKAWMHFTQRDDPCGFLGQVVDGTVLLDRERFE
jgi:hypothetical protein